MRYWCGVLSMAACLAQIRHNDGHCVDCWIVFPAGTDIMRTLRTHIAHSQRARSSGWTSENVWWHLVIRKPSSWTESTTTTSSVLFRCWCCSTSSTHDWHKIVIHKHDVSIFCKRLRLHSASQLFRPKSNIFAYYAHSWIRSDGKYCAC